MPAAVGADALLGISIDDPSDIFAAGHPSFLPAPLPKPTTPTADLADPAAPGLITPGVRTYIVRNVNTANKSLPSDPVSVTIVDEGVNGQVELGFAAGPTGTTAREIYRTVADGAEFLLLTTIADNTTLVFTDNVADGTLGAALPAYGNNGLKFLKKVSHTGGPKQDMIDLAELDGAGGPARKLPGMISLPFSMAGVVQAGGAVPIHAAQWGKPTKTTLTAGVYQYDWDPRTSLQTPRSLSFLWYKGSTAVKPYSLYGLFAPKQTYAVSAGQVIKDTVTFAGIHHGVSGVSEVGAGGETYAGCIVARGRRADALRDSDALYVKVTSAPSAGTFKAKMKVGTVATYDGPEYTLYYNTTSKRQTMGGVQACDWVEAYDKAGLKLGADTCTNRTPYEILFTGDCTGLQVNDEYIIPVSALIPGTGAAPFSGVAPTFAQDCRLNWADAVLTVDGNRVISIKSFSLALDVPWKPVLVLGSKVPEDMRRSGKYGNVLTFSRDLLDRSFDDKTFLDSRIASVVTLSGPPIGTTIYRKSIRYTSPQMSVLADADVPNAEALPENIVLTGEDTDAGASSLAIRVITDQNWTFV